MQSIQNLGKIVNSSKMMIFELRRENPKGRNEKYERGYIATINGRDI